MKKISLTAVSYLNTKPLLFGLFKSPVADLLDIQLDIPSVCAQKLSNGEADLGLVPVAVLPHLETPYVISDYCIGTVGAVKTVGIFSQCPIEEITHLYLDHHSRTSVELAKILLEEYWRIKPQYVAATEGYQTNIKGTAAGVIIGDRTIGQERNYRYFYDLGAIWQAHTGLPFVFAAWVSTRPLDPQFVSDFNQALKQGIDAIPQLIYLIPPPHPEFDLGEYYTHHISYEFDQPKRRALSIFLEKISKGLQPSLEASLALVDG